MVFACTAISSDFTGENSIFSLTASAASSVTVPRLSKINIYSNKIELKISNLSSYNSATKFVVIMDSKKIKTYSYSTLKKSNVISVFHNGNHYLKPNTSYKVYIAAVVGSGQSSSFISVKTPAKTYYSIPSATQLYKLQSGKYTALGKTSKLTMPSGTLFSSTGTSIAGKSCYAYDSNFVRIDSGDYKGKYVKVVVGKITRITERTANVRTVVDYAKSMNGGSYVWGGASYRATDCSGLTMLSYAQVGKNISHSVYTQAKMGKAVSLKNIQPGDLIICNNYGHVAMYIGNNNIVHAMSPSYGIKIQNISNIKYCGAINTIRRIL